MLLTLTDKDAVLEYIKDTVLPLYDYDKMNHTDLVKVLRCYLENDCSVKETAQELIVHRNTVNYKIGKASGSQVNVNRALFFILSKNKFVYRKTNLKNK